MTKLTREQGVIRWQKTPKTPKTPGGLEAWLVTNYRHEPLAINKCVLTEASIALQAFV